MYAGVKHAGDNVIGRPVEDALPLPQEALGIGIGRTHPGEVTSGYLYTLPPTRSDLLRYGGVKEQTSGLIASHGAINNHRVEVHEISC